MGLLYLQLFLRACLALLQELPALKTSVRGLNTKCKAKRQSSFLKAVAQRMHVSKVC